MVYADARLGDRAKFAYVYRSLIESVLLFISIATSLKPVHSLVVALVLE